MKKASKKKSKKPGKLPLAPSAPPRQGHDLNPSIVELEKAAVCEIIQAGKTADKVLELAFHAFVLAEHLVGLFEAENTLPQPVACKAGCNFCCFNQVEVTPPEALLIGHYVEQHFSAEAKEKLAGRLTESMQLRSGKDKAELAQIRQENPCPLLEDGHCAVYSVRPLVCRAMHSLNAEKCERDMASRRLTAVPYYAHRQEIILSLSAGLQAGCRVIGCQADSLDLSRALQDYAKQDRARERWLRGEKIFI